MFNFKQHSFLRESSFINFFIARKIIETSVVLFISLSYLLARFVRFFILSFRLAAPFLILSAAVFRNYTFPPLRFFNFLLQRYFCHVPHSPCYFIILCFFHFYVPPRPVSNFPYNPPLSGYRILFASLSFPFFIQCSRFIPEFAFSIFLSIAVYIVHTSFQIILFFNQLSHFFKYSGD